LERHEWSRLSPLQIGRYAEYLVKMEFTLYGFDVYSAEVDDKGIDFVIRKENRQENEEVESRYYDVQVKSVRAMNYVFFRKDRFAPRDNLLAAVALFKSGNAPELYLIPATAWRKLDALLVDRDYEGLKSPPEWGLNLSRRTLVLLERFRFEDRVSFL
jgi:hypothetical protein